MALDLLALRAPLEPVKWPDGREFPVRPFGPAEWAAYRAMMACTDPEAAAERGLALLRRVVPTLDDAALAVMVPEDMVAVLGYAAGKISLVLDALKNGRTGQAPTTAQPTRRSGPKTTSPSRSRGTRGRSTSTPKPRGRGRST